MIRFMVVVVVLAIAGICMTTKEAEAGYGSCYEVQPICIGTQPVCMCNQQNYCFWACR